MADVSKSAAPGHFNSLARILHWVMAIAILAMLFIGVGMMTSRCSWAISAPRSCMPGFSAMAFSPAWREYTSTRCAGFVWPRRIGGFHGHRSSVLAWPVAVNEAAAAAC